MTIDRKSIMTEAWATARRVAKIFGGTPASRLASALKSAWKDAKKVADPVGAARALAARLMRVTVTPTGRDPWAASSRRIAALQPMGICPELDAAIRHHAALGAAIVAAREARIAGRDQAIAARFA